MRSPLLMLALLGCQAEGQVEPSAERVAELEAQVASLTEELDALQARVPEQGDLVTADDLDAALPAEAIATEPWVEANYAQQADIDATLAAELPAEAIATRPWVQANTRTPDAIDAAIDNALADHPTDQEIADTLSAYATTQAVQDALASYATTQAVQDALASYATTQAVQDGLAAYATTQSVTDLLQGYVTTTALEQALPEGTVADQQWVADRYVPFDALGEGLWVDAEDAVRVDPDFVTGLAHDQAALTNVLDGVYLRRGAAARIGPAPAGVDCTDPDHLGTIRYLDGEYAGCTPDGWMVLGGADDGSTPANAGDSCLQILADHGSSATGVYWLRGTDGPYEALCDMETDGGGWTLLGTISGGDDDRWNTLDGYWNDTRPLGSPYEPWSDHKSPAWYDLDVQGAEVMYQRRFANEVKARVVFGSPCLHGRDRFADLFATFDTSLRCGRSDLYVIQAPSDSQGLAKSDYREGQRAGIGGSDGNGWCWNGGDDVNNTFRGRGVWAPTGYSCVDGGHYGGFAVWRSGDPQYDEADITGTNWVYGTDHGATDISFFVR